ncbi:MAG TPA: hypothetical protein VGR80_11885, partial [Steroidobacteraceae bacterium]|nr:hypothetical protein [Steroidobacteraceae bacterium]
MPSSTSSSEARAPGAAARATVDPADRYARQSAADRPGVAQPVPTRPVPAQAWGRIILWAVVLAVLLVGGWEAYWRSFGARPGYRNTYGLWAIQRRRIDAGEGDATVLVGASRVYYDIELPVWERLDGRRPIQLAFEGTSPLGYLEDLAADPKFTGRVLIGVAPDLFFSGFEYRGGAVRYTRKESPSEFVGQWLSMRLIEPYLAFEDADFSLATVLERQPWPERPGKHVSLEPRKLGYHDADRNSYLWDKVADDPEYHALWQRIWHDNFQPSPDDPTPQEALKIEQEQIARAARVVAALRAHGVKMLFVRMPSSGEYLDFENANFPRARTWDKLLAATGAQGIHFEDYPELQGYYLPEWSHMTRPEAERFTAALYRVVMRDFWGPHAPASAAA